MVQSQFSLSWDSYKSSICNGFSSLQQNGEFVDMTLAADGHLVKVHKMLIALASPYLKDLISSAPCQHPVLFLNNVSHRTLCLLLEYIYTGEVLVPSELLTSFIDTAKALHIKGLEGMSYNEATQPVSSNLEETEVNAGRGTKRSAAESVGQLLPLTARKVQIKQENQDIFSNRSAVKTVIPVTSKEEDTSYPEMAEETITHDSDDDHENSYKISEADKNRSGMTSSNLQFTVSIRGSLQVILNRYMYNLQSAARGRVRRWRCVDYRNLKCAAFLVTNGNVVLNRANPHNHPFHDKKILSKIEKNAVYSALDDVVGYKEKERELDEAGQFEGDYDTETQDASAKTDSANE